MSIKTFFWNARGLNLPSKHIPLSQWLLLHKPIFGALLETHIKEPQLSYVMSKACQDWNFTSNHSSDPDGRIIIIWKNPATVRVLSQTRQSMTCEVEICQRQKICFTAVYASNCNEERQDLWVDLINLHQTLQLSSTPWILGGDFNQITHPAEHSSPLVNSLTPPMISFRNVLYQLEVFDLRYTGPLHTWSNKSPSNPTAEKLDRLLANHSWISLYPNSHASFLPPEFSDHSPCLLDLSVPLPIAGTRPFKFYNYLTKHHNFTQTIAAAWEQAGGYATNLSALCYKLRKIKGDLKALNRSNFSNIQERVRETNCLLQVVQVQALTSPTPDLFQQEKELYDKWCFLRAIEESYFKQKSRVNWLKEGDLNTAYFHRLVQVRASFNSIRSFTLPSGALVTDPIAMGLHAISHFQAILAPSVMPLLSCPPTWFQSILYYRCPIQLSQGMIKVPDAEEITRVLMKLNSNKSPGPDGLTSGFFKASWPILGSEVLLAISNFFATGFLPSATNATILTLVPKRPGATSISDFRPISCCNTIYKCISKMLVHRLKPILTDLVLPNQTAFVQGRLLVENTVLAAEVVNGYHRNKGPKRIAIKVDIAKAFDTISWDFIFSCLYSIGIPNLYIRWLQACVCTPSFTVGFNGTVQGYFKSSRGLRQGDPLSPYLFVIAMNCLSVLLNKGAEEGKFGYHHNCKETKLTHLCFADDLMIFMEGTPHSVSGVLEILKEFETRSGLGVSITKTCFFSCGLSQQEIDNIKQISGLSHGTLPIRYLGVPLCTRKLSMTNCEPLILSVKGKLSSWSAKTLSFAGRLLLINTVISGITNFWSATFTLPKFCIKTINSLCGAYLWKGSIEGSYTARVSWDTITHAKEEGGLGVRDLLSWNKATGVRLIWLLFFRSGSIWVAWFIKEVLGGELSNFWTVKESARHSWLVKRLLRLRPTVFTWIQMEVGNGQSTRFWTDNWSPHGRISDFMQLPGNSRLGIPRTATLADLWNDGHWSLPPARSEEQVLVQAHLSTMSLSLHDDSYKWVITNSTQAFSTGTVYKEIKHHNPIVNWAKIVWFPSGIPKHNFLTWLLMLDRCPTRDRLLRWGLPSDPNCLLCNTVPESRDHLFFSCNYSWTVWNRIADRLQLLPDRSWETQITNMQHYQGPRQDKLLRLLSWQATLYNVWSERNARLHQQISKPPDIVAKQVECTIRAKIAALRDRSPRLASAMFAVWSR